MPWSSVGLTTSVEAKEALKLNPGCLCVVELILLILRRLHHIPKILVRYDFKPVVIVCQSTNIFGKWLL